MPTLPEEPKNLASRSTFLVLLAIGAGAAAQWIAQRMARDTTTTSNDLINDGLTLTLLVYLVVGTLIVLFVRSTQTRLRWHEGDPVASVRVGVVRGVAIAAVVTTLAGLAAGRLQGDSRFTNLLSENNGIRILCTLLIAVVAAPLVEETLFRGLLLESWRKYGVALVISGFAFAAWHLMGSAIIYYWLMGIALGRVYVRRGLIGSMATHATFNAVVMGVTIASISGSGHDYDAGSLHAHTPPSWHSLSAAQTARLGDQLALEGPSGSSIEVTGVPHPNVAPDQLATKAHQDLAAALSRLGGALGGTETVTLSLGPAERATVEFRQRPVDVYVVETTGHAYVIAVNTASSKTAAKQIPGILDSLSEK